MISEHLKWNRDAMDLFGEDSERERAGAINPSETLTDKPSGNNSSVWPCLTALKSTGDHSASW